MENCRVFMDQRPQTYTKCTGEINTSFSSLTKQPITDIVSNELCNIEIIILIVYNPLPQ